MGNSPYNSQIVSMSLCTSIVSEKLSVLEGSVCVGRGTSVTCVGFVFSIYSCSTCIAMYIWALYLSHL